jgi:hypothetical protein
MSIRNCPECGRLFEFVYKNLCPECNQKEEDDFDLVANYLKKNPGVGLDDISEATGVTVDTVIKMLKSGRLLSVCEGKNIALLTCGRCGKPIINGHYCQQCLELMSAALKGTAREPGRPAGERAGIFGDAGGGSGSSTGSGASSKKSIKAGFTSHFNK